jgi:hypothetical protein
MTLGEGSMTWGGFREGVDVGRFALRWSMSRRFRVNTIVDFRFIVFFIGAALLASCAQAQYGASPSNSIGQATRLEPRVAFGTYPSPAPGRYFASIRGAASGRGWLSPASTSGQPLLYVADGSKIWIYPETGSSVSPIGEITNGVTSAYGLFVDRYQDLYLTNWQNNTVEMYPPGSVNPSREYSASLREPLYAVVNHEGNLFVSNADGGTVTEFLAGSTTVRRSVQSEGTEADGMDFDRHGNLYVAYRTSSGAGIDRFSPDLQHRRNLGISLVQPQGLIVTHSGAIFVVETNYASALDKFLPGQQTPELHFVPPHTLTELALARDDRTLYASSLEDQVYSMTFPLSASSLFDLVLTVGSSGYPPVQGMALSNGQRF